MENCVNMITKNQIKLYRMCELKKMMLKNKKMKVYFEEHPIEKAVILKDLTKMHLLIDNNAHKIPAVVPDYLTPSF